MIDDLIAMTEDAIDEHIEAKKNAKELRKRVSELTNGELRISSEGIKSWHNANGIFHRDHDLPAIIWPDGRMEWRQDGMLHRVNGPAVVHPKGITEWRQDGMLHRPSIEGPAFIEIGKCEKWFTNGLLHRPTEEGPAQINADGSYEYRVHGKHVIPANGKPTSFRLSTRYIVSVWNIGSHNHRQDGPAWIYEKIDPVEEQCGYQCTQTVDGEILAMISF